MQAPQSPKARLHRSDMMSLGDAPEREIEIKAESLHAGPR